MSSIEISKFENRDNRVDCNKTKCGEILISFTTFTFEFICILCNEEFKFVSFSELFDHIAQEHTVCSENGDSPISVDNGYTTEMLVEDPLVNKLSETDDEEMKNEDESYKHVQMSSTEFYEPPNVVFHTVTDVLRVSKRDTVTFTQRCPKNNNHSKRKFKEKDTPNRQHIVELLEMYRKCIGLWHTKTASCTPNALMDATLRLLVRKYKSRSSVPEMRTLLKRMTICFNAAWKTNAERDYRPWYYDDMEFLKFADVDEIPDKEFGDFLCPFCAKDEVIASDSMELWNHIIEHHKNFDNMAEAGSNIIPLHWPTEHILQFIGIYREQESLWNIKCRDYHNRSLKVKAYQTIIDKFNDIRPNVLKSRDSVKDAIKHLRDYFHRVDKKYQVSNLLDKTENTEELENYKIYEELLFLKNVYLSKHRHLTETYACDLCGKTFKRKSLIHEHFKLRHKDSAFKCDQCPMVFGSEVNLKSHRDTHDKGDGRTYNCPICHLEYSNSNDLETHLFDHLPNRLHEQICELCGAKFEERHNLVIHIRRHSNIKNYVCGVCKKRFVTSTEMKSHSVVHSNEKPFICEVCGLGFKYQNSLNTHHLVHEEPRFKCKDCDMKFITRRYLIEHESVHADPWVPLKETVCELCRSVFGSPDSLSRHKRKVHNIRKRNICYYPEEANGEGLHEKSNKV